MPSALRVVRDEPPLAPSARGQHAPWASRRGAGGARQRKLKPARRPAASRGDTRPRRLVRATPEPGDVTEEKHSWPAAAEAAGARRACSRRCHRPPRTAAPAGTQGGGRKVTRGSLAQGRPCWHRATGRCREPVTTALMPAPTGTPTARASCPPGPGGRPQLGGAPTPRSCPGPSCPQPASAGPRTSAHTAVAACSEAAGAARRRSVWAAAINHTSVSASDPSSLLLECLASV